MALIRFWQDESGAALVEFALLLPMLLVVLALSVEGGRTFWAYQTTITGVRDAARYLSRVAVKDICNTGGSTAAWDQKLTEIVRNAQGGAGLFPAGVTVDTVTSSLSCRSGDYRGDRPGVATVTAQLSIQYPFAGLLTLVGVSVGDVATTVSDQTRVLGI